MQPHKDGICPLCGSDIEYVGSYDHDDDGATLDWTCPNCGARGKARYTIFFDQHYKIQDANGNEVKCDDTAAAESDTDEEPGIMTGQLQAIFRQLVSKYCIQEINLCHCDEDCCDLCSVNHAYDEIYHKIKSDTDDDIEQEE